MKRMFMILLLSAFLSCGAAAVELLSPSSLSTFTSSPVYSISQDSFGAIWFNTSNGPYRYNGHTLSKRGESTSVYLSKFATADRETFYLNQPEGLTCFHSSQHGESDPVVIAPSLPENSPLLAEADSLIFGRYNVIYSYKAGHVSVVSSLRDGTFVRSLHRLASGQLLVSTFHSGIGVISDGKYVEKLPLDIRIVSTFLSDDGTLWAGTSDDGLLKIDTSDFSIAAWYHSPDDHSLLDVRCFTYDNSGNLYFGAASGLFRLDTSGGVQRISFDQFDSNSVCDVFIDSDGNLWVGTYDNGVYYANLTSFPFTNYTSGLNVGTPRGIVLSDDGVIWVASDSRGLHCLRDGEWHEVPSLRDYKFQSACYDSATGDLFLGNWDGMVRYNPRTGKHDFIRFAEEISVGSRIPVFAICRDGSQLYLGTTIGAFLYDPETESVISRRVHLVDRRIDSIVMEPSGDLLLGGRGLFRVHGSSVNDLEEFRQSYFVNMMYDAQGTLWGGVSKDGIFSIDSDGTVTSFSRSGYGIPNTSINYIVPSGDGRVVIGTALGVSIIDPSTRTCRNFDRSNGMDFKSTSVGGALCLPDGSVLLGGNGAIELLRPDDAAASDDRLNLVFDGVTVNDKPLLPLPSPGTNLILGHDVANISFDMTDFDYSGVRRYVYKYKLDGIDDDWREFDISEPILCMNLSPGRYRIRVRETDNSDSVRAEVSMPFRIMPVWYLSLPFIILWLLIMSGIFIFILYNVYSRNLLRRRLILEEEQNARQSSFFLNLSLKMRTPLNLMIGQIERYFKEYGSRARGVEDIQDVYGKATEIRGMISDFVDDSNERLEESHKYSKILNVATGAVERNLFSGKLDVPLLCAELNMGKTKLTETLKEASGMTPREFIEDIRLRHAAQMILDGNHTVAEVSDNLGFSTPKYFAVRFKRKFGCAPSMYGRKG